MGREIIKDSTDPSFIIRILNDSDGTPKQDVLYSNPTLALWYRREGGNKVAITPIVELATGDAAHANGGFIHIDDGYCRVDAPDAAVADGSSGVLVAGSVDSGVVVGFYSDLIDTPETYPTNFSILQIDSSGTTNANIKAVNDHYIVGTGLIGNRWRNG